MLKSASNYPALPYVLLLLVALMQPYSTLCNANAKYCSDSSYFDCYSYLYLKLEEALINDQESLNKVRTSLISARENIEINLQLEVAIIGYDTCGECNNNSKTFYNSDSADYMWKSSRQYMNYYGSPSYETENRKHTINIWNTWLFRLHGTTAPLFINLAVFENFYFYFDTLANTWDLKLRIEELKCNPSLELTQCVLSELFGWIKVYSYAEDGSKPLTWDRNMKGSIIYPYSTNDVIQPLDLQFLFILGLAEYVFVSLSVALVIAKFFPAIHSQIVTKAAGSLEYQSLYWGSAVVANVFTYGLVFLVGRGWSIWLQCEYNPASITDDYNKCTGTLYILSTTQLVVYIMLFAGALIASLRSPRGIPIPTGMGKVFINISFCCSCFCCCVCCSPRYRAKALQVLIMFSFMSFIYHSIMDVISIGFMLFVISDKVIVITLAFLYISLISFFVIFTSLSLFLMLHGPLYKRSLKCLGGAIMLVTVFGAVMLIVIMYMIMIISLKLTGISGLASGLIPSVALSVASWYMKKKLFKEKTDNLSISSAQSEHGYREPAVNDGGMHMEVTNSSTDLQEMLLP